MCLVDIQLDAAFNCLLMFSDALKTFEVGDDSPRLFRGRKVASMNKKHANFASQRSGRDAVSVVKY